MNEENLRNYSCCFTGHRPEKLYMSEIKVKELLRNAIKQAVQDGFTTFITGMARGIDIWAAEIVLEERELNEDIKLVCAVPYIGFEKKWSVEEKSKYEYIIMNADFVQIICEHYFRSCFQVRNAYMVDRCSRVIAVFNGGSGGTKNTISYAKRKNVEVINIYDGEIIK